MNVQFRGLRGVKKNLAKQVRGRACKFRFSVVYEYLDLKCTNKWKPNNLSVVWFRSHRSKTSRKPTCRMSSDDETGSISCSAQWNPPHTVDLVVTLYKDSSGTSFRKKEYMFVVENVSKGERKKLAIFPCNMSGYASVENEVHDLEMEFKTLSKKVVSCKLGVKISCEFIKEGNAGEDDMESNFSHLSAGDQIHRMSELIECSDEEEEEKKVGDVDKIRDRSKHTWSQFVNDMKTLEYKQLSLVENPLAEDRDEFNQLQRGLGSDRSLSIMEHGSSSDSLSVGDRLGANSLERENNRRVVSAIVELVEEEEDEDQAGEKESSDYSLPPYSGHSVASSASPKANYQFVFPRKKLARSETLPLDLPSSPGALPQKNKSQRVQEWLLDVNDSHHDLRIRELEKENAVLKGRNNKLETKVEDLMKEKDELQAEIGELQLLVEDLKTKLAQNEQDHLKAEEEEKEKMECQLYQVRGWLCKRGVKGPTANRWRRRWFATGQDGKLHYYKKNNNRLPRGYIDLEAIIAVQDRNQKEQDINNALFNVVTAGRTYELMAHDEEEKHRWINALDYLRHSPATGSTLTRGTAS